MKKNVIPILIWSVFFIFANKAIAANVNWEVLSSDVYVRYIWGTSSSNIVGVGNWGLAMHYDGTSWTEKDTGTSQFLRAIWGSSSSDIFAVGEFGAIVHYNGSSWTAMDTGGYGLDLYAVWGRSATDVYATGQDGNILHYDGTSWTWVISEGTYYSITGVTGNSTSVYACTEGGNILQSSSITSWGKVSYTTYKDSVYFQSAVTTPDGITILAGYDLYDENGFIYKKSSGFNEVTKDITGKIYAVWAASANDIYAVGKGGIIVYFDGATVTEMNSGTTSDIRGIWGTGSEVFAVDGINVLHFSAPPKVTSTDPEDGDSDVAVNKVISVTFSSAMNAATVDSTTFRVKDATSYITGTVQLSGQTATFTPDVDLDYNTTYTASVSSSVQSSSGVEMGDEYSWSFYPLLGYPVADAGDDQTVDENVQVTLDATGSSDPNDAISTYKWEQTDGDTVTISNSTLEQATFIAPDVTPDKRTFTFQVTVTDSTGLQSTDTVVVTVNWGNNAPTADAGADQTASEGSTIKLDASSSSDADDGISSYKWEQTGGTTVTLSDDAVLTPTFVHTVGSADETLTFQLTVTDKNGLEGTDSVNITVTDNGITSVTTDFISFKSSTDKEMGAKITSGGNITNLSVTESDVLGGAYKPENMIYGIIDISVKVATPGDSATVVIKLPEAAPADYKWYKYANFIWTDFSDFAVFNSDRTQVTLTLVDGGDGDSDGLANGIIVDPSALGTEPSDTTVTDTETDTGTDTSTGTSSSSGPPAPNGFTGEETGCFISTSTQSFFNIDLNIFYSMFIYPIILSIIFYWCGGFQYRISFVFKRFIFVVIFLSLSCYHSAFAFDSHTRNKKNAISVNIGAHFYSNKGMPMDYWISDSNDFNSLEMGIAYERNIGDEYGLEVLYGAFDKDKEYEGVIRKSDTSIPKINNTFLSFSMKRNWYLSVLWKLYLGGGPDYYYTKTRYMYDTSSKANDYSLKESFHSYGVHGLVGVEYLMNPRPHEHLQYDLPFGIFMEYRYSWVIIKDADKTFKDDYNSANSTQLSYNDKNTGGHLISVGFRWHF